MSDDKKDKGQNEESHDNVIRFPVERVKSKRKLKKLAGKMNDNKKATLFLSLLSVMVMSAYLLQGLGEKNRELASSDNRDRSKEQQLAKDLQNTDKRIPASYGRRPSSEEDMRRDLMNYHFENDEGYFFKAEHQEGANKAVLADLENGDLEVFLLKYSDYIISGEFNEVRKYEFEGMSPRSIYYELLNNGASTGYYVEFKLEPEGSGLDSIKVQAIRKP